MCIMAENDEPPEPSDAEMLESLSQFLTNTPPRDPGWILDQLGLPRVPVKSTEPPPPRLSDEEIEEMMQELLRGELKRFGLLDEDGNLLPSFQVPE